MLAEELGLPFVAFADSLEPGLKIKRQTGSGWELLEAKPPVVVSITNDEHNVPRIPKVRDVMMAHRQPLTRIEVDVEPGEYYEVVDLSIPVRESKCDFVDVDAFAARLLEAI